MHNFLRREKDQLLSNEKLYHINEGVVMLNQDDAVG
jgi:hypothetical protein